MSRRPEDIRREIDQARGDLGVTLEAIGDRVSPKLAKERAMGKVTERMDEINDRVNPKRIVRRRSERVRMSMRNARDSVMGTVDGVEPARATDSVRGGADRVSRRASEAKGALSDGVSSAPEVVRTKTQGSPLLVGLVAFGGGLVLASAVKASEAERQAAERILKELEPVKEQLMSAGKDVAGELQQSAQGRAEQVKKRATSSTQRLKSEAQTSVEEVRGRLRERPSGCRSGPREPPSGCRRKPRAPRSRCARRRRARAAPSRAPPALPGREPRARVERAGRPVADGRRRSAAVSGRLHRIGLEGHAPAHRQGVQDRPGHAHLCRYGLLLVPGRLPGPDRGRGHLRPGERREGGHRLPDGSHQDHPSGDAAKVLAEAVDNAPSGGASLVAAVVGLVLALFSASAGMVALQNGLDVAYDVPQERERKYVKKRLRGLLLMVVAGVLGGVATVFTVFGQPLGESFSDSLPFGGGVFVAVWTLVRWLLAIGAIRAVRRLLLPGTQP